MQNPSIAMQIYVMGQIEMLCFQRQNPSREAYEFTRRAVQRYARVSYMSVYRCLRVFEDEGSVEGRWSHRHSTAWRRYYRLTAQRH